MSSSPTNKHNSDSNLQNFTNYNNKQTEIKKIDWVTSYTEGSEKTNSFSTISNLLDNLNKNSLNLFYQNSTSLFKKKIDDLNLKLELDNLTDDERNIFLMKIEGFTFDDIAEMLNIPFNRVKTVFYKTRKKLKEEYKAN